MRTIGAKNINVFSLEFILYDTEDKNQIIKNKKYHSIQDCIDDNFNLDLTRHNVYRISKGLYKTKKFSCCEINMIDNKKPVKQLKKENKNKIKKLLLKYESL